MRVSLLIDKEGTILNPEQNKFINYSLPTGQAGSSLFYNQITLEFFNQISQQSNGLYVPDTTSVVKSGLSGTVQFKAYSSVNSPYAVDIQNDTIDISTSCILSLFVGIIESLDITCTDIVGAEYINILLDRS